MPRDSPGRIATLDGLRAVSILLVFAAHTPGTVHAPSGGRFSSLAGTFGVHTFFVISGFLITTLLLREREKTGWISLVDFYKRRVFRIFPAFYVYIAAILLLTAIGWVAVSASDFAFATTYTMNFHSPDTRAWQLGHLWSLAVEEQFYLLWPAVMALCSATVSRRAAIATLLVAPILRTACWYLWPVHRNLVDGAFPCVADTLAWGCALALVRPTLEASPLYRKVIDAPWFWIIPLACLVIGSISRAEINLPIGVTIGDLALVLTLHRCVLHPHKLVGRILESSPLVWIGTLSYSLYLWQQVFLNRHSDAPINAFPTNVTGALAFSVLSFYLVERPILRWYQRRRAR